ncbi:hypothetical protein HK104_009217, partial [Borealophlyctis nickersoniae]
MDMSPAAAIGTNYCGLLMTLTVFGTCLPSYLSIKDVQLQVSITLYFLCFTLNLVINTMGWQALSVSDLPAFGRLNITCSTFYITAFIAQSFYSIRRTCMIYDLSPRVQMYLPLCMTALQCALQYVNSAYWAMDMQVYYGTRVSKETSNLTIVSIVWILATEPVYFGLLQYKIVCSAVGFQKHNTKRLTRTVGLWLEAALRLTLYVTTVL